MLKDSYVMAMFWARYKKPWHRQEYACVCRFVGIVGEVMMMVMGCVMCVLQSCSSAHLCTAGQQWQQQLGASQPLSPVLHTDTDTDAGTGTMQNQSEREINDQDSTVPATP